VRKRLSKKGGAGLASAIAPVAVGVLLAYAWNAAGATRAHEIPELRVPAPYVGVAAEQAAAQAWARITPGTSISTSSSPGARSGSAAATGQRGADGVPTPHVAVSPDCARIPAPRQSAVAGYGTPAAAAAEPDVTVIALAARSVAPSATGSSAGPMTAQPEAAGPARPEPKGTSGPEPKRMVWPGRAEPGGTGRHHRHLQRQETRAGDCPRGSEPAAKADGLSSAQRAGGRQSDNSASETAWSVRRGGNPLLGSSAAERAGSAVDMRAVETAQQT
jgi:hypothetical protein